MVVHQYKSVNGELYQEINMSSGLEKKQKNAITVVHITHAIINMKIVHYILEWNMDAGGLLFFI